MKPLETTLLLLKKQNQILLAQKKQGFGCGKYNGIGGKREETETIEEAMIREAEEEVCITPLEYEKIGEIEFLEYIKGEKAKVKMHIYVSSKWHGILKETSEMKPRWFSVNEIPYQQMFEDMKYWLPFVLKGQYIKGFFEYNSDFHLLSYKIDSFLF